MSEMTDAEKAFEYDRAMEFLAKVQIGGGLVHALTALDRFAFGDAPEWVRANATLKHRVRELEAEVAGFAVLARERYELACRYEREAEQARDALRLAHQMIAIAEEWAEEIQHAGYAVPTGKESEFAAFWDRLQEIERELAGVAFEKPLERDKRQGAIDTALSWMRNSAYVGGPSERDAWRKALEVLGPFGTHHIQVGDGDG